GGGGIGSACIELLRDAGLGVAIADTRQQVARETLNGLDNGAVPMRAYELDIRDPDSVSRVLDQAWSNIGPVDVLVNTAGLYPSDPLLEMSEEAWDRVLDTNLKGPFLCVNAFARRLIAANRPGVAVNVSSGAANRARLGA